MKTICPAVRWGEWRDPNGWNPRLESGTKRPKLTTPKYGAFAMVLSAEQYKLWLLSGTQILYLGIIGFGQRYHLDRHGQLTLKQLRLSVLNEMHTNSYSGPRL